MLLTSNGGQRSVVAEARKFGKRRSVSLLFPEMKRLTIYTSFLLLFVSASPGETPQAQTSETNKRLRQGLERFPEADTNKDGILTMEEATVFLQKRNAGKKDRAPAVPPDHANVAYGPHDRNKLDLWLAETENGDPAPLLICIHGGGFRGGDKNTYSRNGGLLNTMLEAGISVAAINYRLTENGKHPYPIPMHDGARAVQFLRHHAEKYNLDGERFAATGNSAGACMSLWLGFHDDLADPDHEDPILRHSTRLCAIAPNNGQPCIHKPTLLEWFEVESLIEHPGGRPLFGLPLEGEIEWTDELDALTRDASPITHLTKDDPPVFMGYGAYKPVHKNMTSGAWVHHPIMGIKLKEKMDSMEMECHCKYEGGPDVDGFRSQNEFLIHKLNGK